MKTLNEIKEDVANESKYSSWDALLKDIKGDVDLIDFYCGVISLHRSEEAIEECITTTENESWEPDFDKTLTGSILSRLVEKMDNIIDQLK